MVIRQAMAALVKRARWASQLVSSSSGGPTNGASGKAIFPFEVGSEHFKGQPGGVLCMLLYGQAALIIGGGSSSIFAEEISNGMTAENDSGASNNVGLQRVEDGSVISNEHTSKWRIYTDNGRDLFMQGKLNEAERFFSSALAEARKGFGERDPHVASACNNLAELYRVRKSYDKAEPLYLDAIKILEESFGPEDVRVGAAFHNLGQFYIIQRKLEQARVCYERSMKIKGRVLGHGHADYAETMFHLGTVLCLQGNLKDAEVLIQDSIRILEEGGQGESYACIRKLRYLAQIYSKSNNRLEEAENVQRKILHIMELTKGWESLDTVIAAESLSMTLQSMGKLRDARELLERCLDVRRTLLPEDHIQIGANMLRLANVALLNSRQLKDSTISEVIVELDKAKELLTNSTRIAQQILDSTRKKKNIRNYEQRIGRDGHTALAILLQSLKALADVAIAKQEIEETGEALHVFEAEKTLQQCICAFKEYEVGTSNSTSIDLKAEYHSCLKQLLNLITKNGEQSRAAEVEELKGEIRHLEAQITSHRRP